MQAVRDVQEELNDFSGGINTRDADHKLSKNESTEIINLNIRLDGGLVTRSGSEKYNSSAIAASPVHSLYRYYKSKTSFKELLAGCGSTLYKGDDALGTFASVGSLGVSTPCTFETWKETCFITNGSVFKTYDGTTYADVAGTPPIGKYLLYRKERLYVAGASEPNWVYYCDIDAPATWSVGSNFIRVKSNDGDIITGFAVLQEAIVVYKKNSIWMILGYPAYDSYNSTISQVRVAEGVGCIAPRSLVAYKNVHFFRGRDGIYSFNGIKPVKISGKIEPDLKSNPATYIENSVSAFYDERYWHGYTPAGETQNKEIFVYDTTRGSYDDERLEPGPWVKYTNITAASFCLWDGGDDAGEIYVGDSTNGFVRKCDTGSSDDGSDIPISWKSKSLDLGNILAYKKMGYVYLVAKNAEKTIVLTIEGDHGRDSVLLNVNIAGVGFYYFGTAKFGSAKFSADSIEVFSKRTGPVRGRAFIIGIQDASSLTDTIMSVGFVCQVQPPTYREET
jgi:hypothetical protein